MKTDRKKNNPLLQNSNLPFGVFDFKEIKREHFIPAYKEGLKEARKKIKAICDQKEAPTFKNTILALAESDEIASRTMGIYSNLFSLHSDPAFKALSQKLYPLAASKSNEVLHNQKLFARIEAVYQNQTGLTDEEKRWTKLTYEAFVRNGAKLPKATQRQLKRLSMKQSQIAPLFSKNCLEEVNRFSLWIPEGGKEKLEGIPEVILENAKAIASKKGKKGYLFTLQPSLAIPFITYCPTRELRKQMVTAMQMKNCTGAFDNTGWIKKTIACREKKAHLLGFENYAQLVLQERMAKTPQEVFDFLETLYKSYYPAAEEDLIELQAFAQKKDQIRPKDFQIWDNAYYANLLKKEKFQYDEEEFRPYFEAKKVIAGLFSVANKLYDLNFIKRSDLPLYHPDVELFEVREAETEKTIGVLYLDIYPRETKSQGAWMSTFQQQGLYKNEMKIPHVLISANLTPPTPTKPSLLSFSDVNTLFHEFGHALHGLLSKVTYQALSSPDVLWDFVELPSQIMENWLTEKETLNLFAAHYQTQEKLPIQLIEKMKKAQTFRTGSFGLRQISLAYLDMKWHTEKYDEKIDVIQFEKKVTKRFQILPPLYGSAISPSFSHLFAGGYAAGYYSYKWAEVLDADAFELFKEKGIFDKKCAAAFRELLAAGNSKDPVELYKTFRGRKPDTKALLRREGLL